MPESQPPYWKFIANYLLRKGCNRIPREISVLAEIPIISLARAVEGSSLDLII
jgi:hypothetical protein